MNQNTPLSTWQALGAKIKSHSRLFCWLLPLTFVVTVACTFLIPPTFQSVTSLSPENLEALDEHRVTTLQRPENFDLGIVNTDISIRSANYPQILQATTYQQAVLMDTVVTADGSFRGTYYEYLATRHRLSLWERIRLHDTHGFMASDLSELNAIDPFYPTHIAALAMMKMRQMVTFNVDRVTNLVTISAVAQDPMVAAMVARNAGIELEAFMHRYQEEKHTEQVEYMHQLVCDTRAKYQSALIEHADDAPMLHDAYISFMRQAIIVEAQQVPNRTFTVTRNASTPTIKVAPKRFTAAIIVTAFAALLALCIVARTELMQLLFETK